MRSKILSVIAVIVAILLSQFTDLLDGEKSSKVQDKVVAKQEKPQPQRPLVKQTLNNNQPSYNIDFKHILDGEINKRGKAVGGHYLGSDNIKVLRYVSDADKNGVIRAKIAILNENKQWVNKDATTSFFPKAWSKAKIKQEVRYSLGNANKFSKENLRWQGKSSGGISISGWYKYNGDVATAYPIYQK